MGKPAVVGEGLEPSSRGLRGEYKVEARRRRSAVDWRVVWGSGGAGRARKRATVAGRKTRGRRRSKQRLRGLLRSVRSEGGMGSSCGPVRSV